MAKKTTTKRRVHYRKTEFTGKQKQSLQQLVSAALTQHPLVQDRTEAIDAQATEVRLISKHLDVNGFLCGHLVSFERGRYQAMISDDPKAKSLSLTAMSAPKQGNVQHQWVPGVGVCQRSCRVTSSGLLL